MPRHPPCALTNLTTKMLASTVQFSSNGRAPPGDHRLPHRMPRPSPERPDPTQPAKRFDAQRPEPPTTPPTPKPPTPPPPHQAGNSTTGRTQDHRHSSNPENNGARPHHHSRHAHRAHHHNSKTRPARFLRTQQRANNHPPPATPVPASPHTTPEDVTCGAPTQNQAEDSCTRHATHKSQPKS